MEKTITLTEEQLTKTMADVTFDMMTDKKAKDSPTAGIAVMMLGAVINAKVCKKLFHDDEKEEDKEEKNPMEEALREIANGPRD